MSSKKEIYQIIGFFLFLILFGLASFVATKAYLGMFFIAFIATIIMFPIYQWLLKKIKIKIVASFLTMVSFIVILVIPITFILLIAFNEGLVLLTELTKSIQNGASDIDQMFTFITQKIAPAIAVLVDFETINIAKITLDAVSAILTFASSAIIYIATHGAILLVNFGIFLLFLTFFFPEKENLINMMKKIIPLSDKESDYFIDKFTATTEKLSISVVIVPIIQGILMWFIFTLLGVPGAVFWGVITGIVSLIPAIGTTMVWIPATIVFVTQEKWLDATVIFFYGLIIMNFSDNLIRAWLLKGKKTQVPELVTLLSSIGGLFAFGFFGIFYGPIIVITFLSLLDIYKERISNPSQGNKK